MAKWIIKLAVVHVRGGSHLFVQPLKVCLLKGIRQTFLFVSQFTEACLANVTDSPFYVKLQIGSLCIPFSSSLSLVFLQSFCDIYWVRLSPIFITKLSSSSGYIPSGPNYRMTNCNDVFILRSGIFLLLFVCQMIQQREQGALHLFFGHKILCHQKYTPVQRERDMDLLIRSQSITHPTASHVFALLPPPVGSFASVAPDSPRMRAL